MKKVALSLIALALIATGAFADVKWGGWGRGELLLTSTSASGATTDLKNQTTWTGSPRIGFGIHGSSDNVGFDVDLTGDITAIGVGDNARIWVKFNDMVKFDFGKTQGDALRGTYGDFWRYIADNTGDEDAIFQRFYPNNGALVSITPVKGLYIGASVDAPTNGTAVAVSRDATAAQIGAGYQIDGVGHVRAQIVNIGQTSSYINAAFAVSALSAMGIKADLGLKYFTAENSNTTIALGASYSAGSIGATLRTAASVKKGTGADTDVSVALEGTYGLAGTPFTLGAFVGLEKLLADAAVVGATSKGVSLGAFAQAGYSNGFLSVGVNYFLDQKSGTAFNTWELPVVYSYWF